MRVVSVWGNSVTENVGHFNVGRTAYLLPLSGFVGIQNLWVNIRQIFLDFE